MGEIAMSVPTMSPELMTAMNIFGGTGDMTAVSAENNAQCASFGNVLGLLMANSVQTQVQAVPEVTETETVPEMTAADILSEALNGNAETKLPEVFTEKGAAAFIETLSRILPEYDGDELPPDIDTVPQVIDTIWKNVSPEEKSAFAELLYAAAEISEDESIMAEKSPEDIVRIICRIMVSSARKPEKKLSEKPRITDDVVLFQGMNLLRPVQTVSLDDIGKEMRNDCDMTVSAEAVQVQYPETEATEAALSPETASYPQTDKPNPTDTEFTVQPDGAKMPKTETVGKVPLEDIRSAYEKLSEADPEDIVSFCRKLADELNASVKEIAAESVKEAVPESNDTVHIDYGRQGMQGFMSRINRHDELTPDIDAQIVPEQAESRVTAASIPLDEKISEGEDVPSQIIRQIDLYKDIFEEQFSEKELSMKLSPESLGGLEIRIKKSEKGFEITFTAENAEAAELIGSKASELSEALASRGIALKELSVTHQIVTNESDGSLTDENPFGNGGLYGDAQNGQNRSGRQFAFGEQTPSDSAEQTDEGSSDNNFNREAKLWVSA